MAPYQHQPLDQWNIRVMQLLPDPNPEDPNRPIRCHVTHMPLLGSTTTHLFEALSYVWGSDEKTHTIFIEDSEYRIGANLHSALLHLRNRFFPRFLWIDAICINQENNSEKGHQVQNMARIYAMANRVIVWLGEAAADGSTDNGMESIRVAAWQKKNRDHNNAVAFDIFDYETDSYDTDDEDISDKNDVFPDAVVNLLERPWFERIWVLQEVAAARQVLIKCGRSELDGVLFCIGLDTLNQELSRMREDLFRTVSSATYLIRDSIFRSRDPGQLQSSNAFSLSICPLGELIDMFRARKATNPHDKLYALLGMATDNPSEAGLLADYDTSWEVVLEKVTRFCLSKEIKSFEAWDGLEGAVIKADGCVLGTVHDVRTDAHGRYLRWVVADPTLRSYSVSREAFQKLRLGRSESTPVQKGDIICLLRGATGPTIIRAHRDYSTVVSATIPLPKNSVADKDNYAFLANLLSTDRSPCELLLFWNWSTQDPDALVEVLFEDLIKRSTATSSVGDNHNLGEFDMGNLQQRDLERLSRFVNTAILLNFAGESSKVNQALSVALRIFNSTLGKTATDTTRTSTEDMEHVILRYHEDDVGHLGVLLFTAAKHGFDDSIDYFLQKSADVNIRNITGDTPLSLAILGGHNSTVKVLLDAGAIGDEPYPERWGTALLLAVRVGHVGIARNLIEREANVVDCWYATETPLTLASRKGNLAMVQLLLEKGADREAKNSRGHTPLSVAMREGHELIARLLLTDKSLTELSSAVAAGDTNLVKQLLDIGTNREGGGFSEVRWTPLIEAARRGYTEIVQLLINQGAKVDATDNIGQTALHHAAAKGRISVVKQLLERGAKVDCVDLQHQTPLIKAAQNGHSQLFKILQDNGADIEARCRKGRASLQYVAGLPHGADQVQHLVQLGANLNVRDDKGQTPLMIAARLGIEESLDVLLVAGADILAVDDYGQTALQKAWSRSVPVRTLLVSYGATK